MSFKFTFLGLERDSCDCNSVKETPSRKVSRKSNNQRERFKEAVQLCHKTTKNKNSFGKCMSKQLKH